MKLLPVVVAIMFISFAGISCSGKGDGGDGGGGGGGGAGPITVLSDAPESGEKTDAEKPAAETPATETPATETPAVEQPAVVEKPATETPAPETPVSSEEPADKPATGTPAVTDKPDTNGVSSSENIVVVDGKIVVRLQAGGIVIGGENITLTTNAGGAWALVSGVVITIKDNNGAVVEGRIVVNDDGTITFEPAKPLSAGLLYTVTVTLNGKTYTATVLVAIDNICKANSQFAAVTMRSVGNYNVTDLIVNGKAVFGWKFGDPFKIKMVQVENGATVKITAYGIYDVPNHACEVFFQRWADATKKPVQNYVWPTNNGGVTGWIGVNSSDASIDGDADYSFAKTYLEIKIFDKKGNDITAKSKANIIATPWPQGSGLTGYLIAQAKTNKGVVGLSFAGLMLVLGGLFVYNRRRQRR